MSEKNNAVRSRVTITFDPPHQKSSYEDALLRSAKALEGWSKDLDSKRMTNVITCARNICDAVEAGDGNEAILFLVIGCLEVGNTKMAEFRRILAKRGANARHVETYALRNEVIQHWRQHIDPALSNEKAATALRKHFPLSHRKLVQYVSETKKELRAAGKA